MEPKSQVWFFSPPNQSDSNSSNAQCGKNESTSWDNGAKMWFDARETIFELRPNSGQLATKMRNGCFTALYTSEIFTAWRKKFSIWNRIEKKKTCFSKNAYFWRISNSTHYAPSDTYWHYHHHCHNVLICRKNVQHHHHRLQLHPLAA